MCPSGGSNPDAHLARGRRPGPAAGVVGRGGPAGADPGVGESVAGGRARRVSGLRSPSPGLGVRPGRRRHTHPWGQSQTGPRLGADGGVPPDDQPRREWSEF